MSKKLALCVILLWSATANSGLDNIDPKEFYKTFQVLSKKVPQIEEAITKLSKDLDDHKILWEEARDAIYPKDKPFIRQDDFLRNTYKTFEGIKSIDLDTWRSLPPMSFFHTCQRVISAIEETKTQLSRFIDSLVDKAKDVEFKSGHPFYKKQPTPDKLPFLSFSDPMTTASNFNAYISIDCYVPDFNTGDPSRELLPWEKELVIHDMSYTEFLERHDIAVLMFKRFLQDDILLPSRKCLDEIAGYNTPSEDRLPG